MPGRLAGTTALITGGTRGIGAAISLAFAAEGATVLATGFSTEEVTAFKQDPDVQNSERITAGLLDVSQPDQIENVVGSLMSLDLLVNCAGVLLRDQREFQPVGFEQVVDVNLQGTMRMSYACHDLLQAQGGCVLNMASMLSFFGSGFVPAYSASKGAVAQLTKSLAIAWASDGIRVNALAPGWIETPMTQPLRDDVEREAELMQRTPLDRWGQPQEVAAAAVFLCSPEASFITGAILPVDGGYSIT